MSDRIKVGIVGYGNLGRGAEGGAEGRGPVGGRGPPLMGVGG